MTASLFLSRPGTKPHATRIYQQGESFSLLKNSRNVFSHKLFKCGRGVSVRRQRCVLCLICRTVISLGYREIAGTEGGDAPLYLLFFSERAVKQTERQIDNRWWRTQELKYLKWNHTITSWYAVNFFWKHVCFMKCFNKFDSIKVFYQLQTFRADVD